MKKILVATLLLNCFVTQGQCWSKVETGLDCSFGIRVDSTLWAWGYGNIGQLGHPSNQDFNTPVNIDNSKWIALSGGYGSTMGIKKNGTLWGWGDNNYNQLGMGSNTVSTNVPLQVGSDNNWKEVYLYGLTSYGIKNDGTLWGWGENSNGQMGDGSFTDKPSPVQLGTSNWKTLAIGSHSLGFVIAIKTDGTLWSWGMNTYGQLGIGNNTNTFTPTQVGSSTNWVQISVGVAFSFGLKADGTLWSWGANGNGVLGYGNSLSYNIPTQVGTANNWQSICTMLDNRFVLAIKTDGTLWAWGDNTGGNFGNGTYISQNSPTQIGTSTNWKTIAVCGENTADGHAIAIKTDNTLWAWGNNFYGQFGDGTNIDKNIPVAIGCLSNGINEGSNIDQLINIYPNPCKDKISIESTQNFNIEIFDSHGKKVFDGIEVNEIDVSRFNKGVYFIILDNGSNRFTHKLIKE